jgi:sortase A
MSVSPVSQVPEVDVASTAPAAPHRGWGTRVIQEIGLTLITVGVVVFLFVAYQLWGTNITESHNQAKLAKQFSAEVSQFNAAIAKAKQQTPTTPSTTLPVAAQAALPGGVIDLLQIPKIGVTKYVVEGTNEDDLRRGPGHYTGTAYPGQVGNTAIAGHRTTYGAPFFELNNMAPGDPIYLTDVQGRKWVYKVSEAPQVISPSDVAVLNPTPFAQLTLTTCNPRFSASSRLVVFARLVGQSLPPAPPAPPTAKPKPVATQLQGADNLGSGNPDAWTPTILYGLLAIGLWVLARIAMARTRRWYRAGTIVLGIGISLIPLWFCFENAVLLLPQSI